MFESHNRTHVRYVKLVFTQALRKKGKKNCAMLTSLRWDRAKNRQLKHTFQSYLVPVNYYTPLFMLHNLNMNV